MSFTEDELNNIKNKKDPNNIGRLVDEIKALLEFDYPTRVKKQ